MSTDITIRDAYPNEFQSIGDLMVSVYSSLDGFPSPKEQPDYYHFLQHIGDITEKSNTRLLVAVDAVNALAGAVVYIGDMQHYGSGGTATMEKDAAGFRLLAVSPDFRGRKIGKVLTEKCISLASVSGLKHMIIHTTEAMQTAWGMYERMGFKRALDLDFEQKGFPVFGFRLVL
ncbi:MAG: GNAT family N-acetyltransferase [Ekhidna sp.]